jgi:hypothetical protein
VDEIVQLAKKFILEMGYHEPILFVKGTTRKVVIGFKRFGDNSSQRELTMRNAGAHLAYKDNVGELGVLVFVDEAWMGMNLDVLPSEDPKRIEVLIINTFDMSSQEEAMICFEMVRNKEGKITDLKQNFLPEGGSVKGVLLPAFRKGYQMIRPTTN